MASSEPPVTSGGQRRRASRAAGPASADVPAAPIAIVVEAPAGAKVRSSRPVGPPPRRKSNTSLVALVAFVALAVAIAVLAGSVVLLATGQRSADNAAARDQRFVDTASQTVTNMFSYDQNNIDESVNSFVNG